MRAYPIGLLLLCFVPLICLAKVPSYQLSPADTTLKSMTNRWAKQDGVTLKWNASFDVQLDHGRKDSKMFNKRLADAPSFAAAVSLAMAQSMQIAGKPLLHVCTDSPTQFTVRTVRGTCAKESR